MDERKIEEIIVKLQDILSVYGEDLVTGNANLYSVYRCINQAINALQKELNFRR